MITAECCQCGKHVEVPSTWAMHYVMVHQIPCRECFNKGEGQ